jgi:hypothetical protein
MTEALAMRDRVRLQQDADHIGVWPDRPSRPPRSGEPAEEAEPTEGAEPAEGAS